MKDTDKSREQLLAEVRSLRRRVAELQDIDLPEEWEDSSERRYIDEMAFLSQSAMGFLKLGPDDNIHGYIASRLHELVGDCCVGASSVDEEAHSMTLEALAGVGSATSKVIEILGTDPLGLEYAGTEESFRRLMSEGVCRTDQELRDSLGKRFPQLAVDTLLKVFRVGAVYSIGFQWDQHLYGSATVILKEDRKLECTDSLEAFRSQAAIALKHWMGEREVRLKEAKYRALFDGIPIPAFRVHLKTMKILECNRALALFLGFDSPRDVVRQHTLRPELVKGGESQELLRLLKEKGRVRNLEWTGKRPNGEEVVLLISGTVNPEERIFEGSFVDITGRKRAEDRAELQASMLEQIRSAVVATDISGYVTYWNTGAEELFQRPRAEVAGLRLPDVLGPPSGARLVQGVFEKVVSSGGWSGELAGLKKDGTIFPAHVDMSVFLDSRHKPAGTISVATDITEQRHDREAVTRRQQALELMYKVATSRDVSPQALYEQLVDYLSRLLCAEYVRLVRIIGVECRLVAGRQDSEAIAEAVCDMPGAPCFVVFQSGKTLMAGSRLKERYPHCPHLSKSGAAAFVGAPLKNSEGKVVGVLGAMRSDGGPFDTEEARLVELFAKFLEREFQ